MDRTVNFLKKAGTFYLATIENNKPRVRPFGALSVYQNRIYICTNNTKDCFKQMMQNNRVEISAVIGNEWIRVSAKVVQDPSEEAKKAMLKDNPMLNSLYSINDGIFEVLYLKDAIVSFNQFGKEKEEETF